MPISFADGRMMATTLGPSLRRVLRHGASVLGIVAFTVLTTILVQRLLEPPPATAQSSQGGVVRASGFEVVGADGTVLARLSPGAAGGGTVELFNAAGAVLTRIQTGGGGGGNIQLFDAQGNSRLRLAGEGALNVYDPSGALRFRAGNTVTQTQTGPAFNGVQLDADGS